MRCLVPASAPLSAPTVCRRTPSTPPPSRKPSPHIWRASGRREDDPAPTTRPATNTPTGDADEVDEGAVAEDAVGGISAVTPTVRMRGTRSQKTSEASRGGDCCFSPSLLPFSPQQTHCVRKPLCGVTTKNNDKDTFTTCDPPKNKKINTTQAINTERFVKDNCVTQNKKINTTKNTKNHTERCVTDTRVTTKNKRITTTKNNNNDTERCVTDTRVTTKDKRITTTKNNNNDTERCVIDTRVETKNKRITTTKNNNNDTERCVTDTRAPTKNKNISTTKNRRIATNTINECAESFPRATCITTKIQNRSTE